MSKIFVSAVALTTALALSGPALAVSSSSHPVNVNINVLPVVSMWSNDSAITLNLDGFDANNSAWAYSSLSVINNVDANVTATVTGNLPTPIVGGGGVIFHIFGSHQDMSVNGDGNVTVFAANAYNTPGAANWTKDQAGMPHLGDSQTIIPATGVNTSIANFPITYAATAPGELPLPDSFDLTVTYTITSN